MSVAFAHERKITSENAETTPKALGGAGGVTSGPVVVDFVELAALLELLDFDDDFELVLLAWDDLLDSVWFAELIDEAVLLIEAILLSEEVDDPWGLVLVLLGVNPPPLSVLPLPPPPPQAVRIVIAKKVGKRSLHIGLKLIILG